MLTVREALRSWDLVATRAELRTLGVTPHAMTRAVRDGEATRVRRGWYAHPLAAPELVRAVRVGGRMASATALRSHGVWVAPDDRLHVHVPESASRLRSPGNRLVALGAHAEAHAGVVLHRDRVRAVERASRLRLPVYESLAQYLREHNDEFGVAAVDSALHLGMLSTIQLAMLARALPRRCRRLLDEIDAAAESGLESIARVRLRRAGVAVQSQVPVLEGIRVDLLIGDRLIIETDGRKFHDDKDAFERDRHRDLTLKSLGFDVVRLSYAQVMGDWETAWGAIATMMARGQHLRLP